MSPCDSTPLQSLGRLIASENAASDLFVLLAELDDRPLITLFDLPPDAKYSVLREERTSNGRLDAVIVDADTGHPSVVIEMKGASDIHGDQLDRYLAWTQQFDPAPKLYLCAFDAHEVAANPVWARITLRDLFSAWLDTAHVHASWLANEIVCLLAAWDCEANQPLNIRTGYYVPDIVTKRLARDLNDQLHDKFGKKGFAGAYRDNGGSPMILAWVPHPCDVEDDSIVVGVDLRSPIRRSSSMTWKLRPYVQVDVTSERNLLQARRLAFELARKIHHVMGYQRISQALSDSGCHAGASALSVRRNDGFNKPARGFDFDAWSQQIEGKGSYPRSGAFFHDQGRRLATILDLDVSALTRYDLAKIVLTIVELLHTSAKNRAG